MELTNLTKEELIAKIRILEQERDENNSFKKIAEQTVNDFTEERISESEAKYQTLFDNTTLGIYETSPNGKIITANDALIKMLGYSSLEDLKKRDLNNEGFEKQTDRVDFKKEVETKGSVSSLDSIWLKKNGEKIIVRENSIAVRDATHKILYYQGIVEDVTQYRLDQKALLEREKNYQDLIEKAKIGISINDIKGNLTYCNQRFLELFGYTEEEVKNKPLQTFIHPDDLERVLNYHKKRLQGEKVTSQYNCKAITKNGKNIHIEVDVIPITKDYKITGTRTYIWDISERKIAEQKLKLSEQKLRTLIEISPVGIILSSLDGEIIDINPALMDMMKTPSVDVLSGKLALAGDFYSNKEDREEILYLLKKEGVIKGKEIKLNRYDGKQLWINFSGVLYTSPNNETLLLSMLIDITKRKEDEEILFNTTRNLTLATRAGGIGIWEYDVINNKLKWDDEMYRIYGITAETFGGAYESWRQGLHPDDVKRSNEEVEAAIRGEKDFDTEFRVIWPDSTIHHIRGIADVECDADGNPLRMIGTNWDITHKKEQEIELQTLASNLKDAQELAKAGSWSIDLATNKITWSDETYRILGLNPQTITPSVGLFNSCIHPDDGDILRARIVENIESKKPGETNFRVKRKDGTIVYVLGKSNFYLDGYGKPSQYYGILQDITEAKEIENSLKELSDRLNEAQAIAHIGSFEVDLTTNLSRWSDETYELLGLDPKTTIPSVELYMSCIHPDDTAFANEQVNESFSLGTKKEFSCRLIKQNDGTVIYSMSRTDIEKDKDGNFIRLFGTVQDITEIKKTETELMKKTQELEAFNNSMLDREMRIIELKEEINNLCEELNKPLKFPPIWK